MKNRRILIGVTGGVAAYKTAALVSQLAKAGAETTVVMTAASEQFIGAATLAALSGKPVARDLFDPRYPLGAHIELARWAELFCVAPATADFLAKAAHGLADDLLSALYLCFPGPKLAAPSMNVEMWQAPAVQRTVAQLQADGVEILDPDEGWLSCRVQGKGRMAEPDVIFTAIARRLGESSTS
jgi:phosphopantothenoylcysteine decarboxylase/phosphopantothenate--cysteine ligase